MNTNWVTHTTSTTGTGNITLTALPGFPTIASQLSQGQLFKYQIVDISTGGPIEQGMGRLTAPDVMERARVDATFVGGVYNEINPTPADLGSGNKRVIVSLSANSYITKRPTQPTTHNGMRLYGSNHVSSTVGSGTLIGIYAIPFNSCTDSPIDGVVCNIQTLGSGSAGGQLVAEIRAIDITGAPGALLSSGTTTVSQTGITVVPIPPVTPTSKFYVIFKTTNTNYNFSTTSSSNTCSGLGFDANLNAIPHLVKSGTGFTGTSMPSTWERNDIPTINSNRPILMVKCVTLSA